MREYVTTLTYDFAHGGQTITRYHERFPLVYLAMVKDAPGLERITLRSCA